MCLNINICQSLFSSYANMSNFHAIKVVMRCSETQLPIGEN